MISPDAALSPQAYAFLADVVYRRSRIRLGPDRQAFVASRLANRLRELGCATYDDYCRLLGARNGDEEAEALIDLISTNHTRFFREPAHFDLLARHVLPAMAPRAAAAGRGLRIWSAAAASGEEAYSIAIVLAEQQATPLPRGWTVLASDISRRMLQRCRMGIYEARAVELPDPRFLGRHFLRGFGEREGFYRVKPELRRHVQVAAINLFQESYPLQHGQDVIFCRNVMIYFDAESRQALVERLFDQLAPGGFLFIGHAESLLGLRHRFRQAGPSLYERPL
ncbi:MAG: CheR family methyltransferase [Planctomycetia bacterium]